LTRLSLDIIYPKLLIPFTIFVNLVYISVIDSLGSIQNILFVCTNKFTLVFFT